MPERFLKKELLLHYHTIPRSKQAKKGKIFGGSSQCNSGHFQKKKKKTRTIHTDTYWPGPSPRLRTIRTNMTLAYRPTTQHPKLTPAHSLYSSRPADRTGIGRRDYPTHLLRHKQTIHLCTKKKKRKGGYHRKSYPAPSIQYPAPAQVR